MSSPKQKLRLAGAVAALLTLALAVSCRGFFVNPTIASFVISPTSPTVPLGGTLQMQAFGTDSQGQPTGDITSKITWSSTASGVVSVTSSGLLKGLTLSATPVPINASYQALPQQTANATVCVDDGGNFLISPANSSIGHGNLVPFTASTVSATQGTLDITAATQWSTNNTEVTITNGTTPVNADTTGVLSPPVTVTITAIYSCNGVSNTFTTTLTVN